MHDSASRLWKEFVSQQGLTDHAAKLPDVWHFCDNEQDANTCLELTLAGKKRATAPSLWYFQTAGEAVPEEGRFDIVTDWDGVARCVIKTTAVTIIPYNQITEHHAQLEGEGDGTLQWWRDAHWAYYSRELAGTEFSPRTDMPIVFQEFVCVFPS